MEILSVQNQYPERFSIISNTTKTKGKCCDLKHMYIKINRQENKKN